MANGSFINGGAYLNVDMSELNAVINLLRAALTKKQFENLMHRTFKEVGERSKSPINQAVTHDYAVGKQWVNSQIGKYRLENSMLGGVKCIIPLNGVKGTIGGRFSASGGFNRRPINTKILRKKGSTLPPIIKNYGGNPPFRNPKSAILNGVAFVRRTAQRFPIVRVVGLGVPQMPLNQSADEVSETLLELAAKRLEHNFNYMFNKGYNR